MVKQLLVMAVNKFMMVIYVHAWDAHPFVGWWMVVGNDLSLKLNGGFLKIDNPNKSMVYYLLLFLRGEYWMIWRCPHFKKPRKNISSSPSKKIDYTAPIIRLPANSTCSTKWSQGDSPCLLKQHILPRPSMKLTWPNPRHRLLPALAAFERSRLVSERGKRDQGCPYQCTEGTLGRIPGCGFRARTPVEAVVGVMHHSDALWWLTMVKSWEMMGDESL